MLEFRPAIELGEEEHAIQIEHDDHLIKHLEVHLALFDVRALADIVDEVQRAAENDYLELHVGVQEETDWKKNVEHPFQEEEREEVDGIFGSTDMNTIDHVRILVVELFCDQHISLTFQKDSRTDCYCGQVQEHCKGEVFVCICLIFRVSYPHVDLDTGG